MFGYFRPYDSGLNRKQARLFGAYYCRLCYCLRILGGQACRAMTTFDLALYSMILDLYTGAPHPSKMKCQRILTSNMNQFQSDETGLKLARLALIGFGEKFRDDELDGDGKTKVLSALFSKHVREAREKEPEIAAISREGTDRVNLLQNSDADLFEVLHAYGDMVAAVFDQFADLPDRFRVLFASVAEWTFFIDMLCDYAEDYKSGSYNYFKTDGCPDFGSYYDKHYPSFIEIEEKVSSRLIAAVKGVSTADSLYYTIYKILMHSLDTVVPALIREEDVTWHYLRELLKQRKNIMLDRSLLKKYGEERQQ